jgi:YetA-like protein
MNNGQINKRIIIEESIGEARNSEPLRVGLPFAMGELDCFDEIALLDAGGDLVPVQATTLGRWKDGSVKWVLLDFNATVPGNSRVDYTLTSATNVAVKGASAIRITPGDEIWQVDTGAAIFFVDAREFRPFIRIEQDGRDVLGRGGGTCLLQLNENNIIAPTVNKILIETVGPQRSIIRIDGLFGVDSATSPRFSCRLHFFAGTSRVIIDFSLLNPQPAHHPGGLWDIGNSGSLFFNGLNFHIPFADGQVDEISCSIGPGADPLLCSDLTAGLFVYQESSGGTNWQSPVHRDRTGKVPFKLCGYELRQGSRIVSSGKRATPLIWCGSRNKGIAAVIPLFWQEFPRAISANRSCLNVALYPVCSPGGHELQGGEQKTSTIYLDFSASPSGLNWARAPLAAFAAPEVYRQAGVLSDLPGDSNGEPSDLLDRFVPDPQDLITKREHIDEFGWRNYGEIYADHESLYHQGDQLFISHYNNQYDPCAGLYRKFFTTGNSQWRSLAADLARHVLDIDIYHTDSDREEYNRGLFWHTDHYIDAGLSTHRSFSREHLKNKDPRFCGGGPGAEHCYSTGLMLHYFHTGDPAFRDAVIDLADWVVRSLSGPFTILAAIKRGIGHLKRLRNSDSNNRPIFPRYPLTRGTGNSITACLDAYEVGGGARFLLKADELIRGTIHPGDNIAARNLLNAEIAWSYTVLLVAVAKYLDKKRELEQFDAGYAYARSSFLAYAEWMLKHEYPYLEKPEILEYPNETWAAQDLRKSVIFYHAARHAALDRRQLFVERGRYFFATAVEELSRHKSSSFTRPVVLMLQNGWVGRRFEKEITPVDFDKSFLVCGSATPSLGIGPVLKHFLGDLVYSVRVTSLKSEIAWLKARLG